MKRAELHIHTNLSDDLSSVQVREVFDNMEKLGLSAVAFTDLNGVRSFPEIQQYANRRNIQVIYGAEIVCRRETHALRIKVTLLVRNQNGIKALYKIISALENCRAGKVLDWSVLARYRENLLVGSCGYDGELYAALAKGASASALEQIAVFYDYFEIYPGTTPEEQTINRAIVELGKCKGIPVVAVSNAHYLAPGDGMCRDVLLLAGKTGSPERGEGYLRDEAKMVTAFSYLGEADARAVVFENPQRITAMIEPVQPLCTGNLAVKIEGALEQISRRCRERAIVIYGNPLPTLVSERLERELALIQCDEIATYYLISSGIAEKLKDDGYYIGCRGTAGSVLVAYLLGFTGVNPLEPHYYCPECHYFEQSELARCGIDLPRRKCPVCQTVLRTDGHLIPEESFLYIDGSKLPDLDILCCSEARELAFRFLQKYWGEDHIARAGCIGTYQEKLAAYYIRKYEEQKNYTFSSEDRARITEQILGMKKTTGTKPGGLLLAPRDMAFEDFTPLDQMNLFFPVTHFSFKRLYPYLLGIDLLESQGFLLLENLCHATGVSLEEIDLQDPEVIAFFTHADTEGIPEFENAFVRGVLNKIKPKTFADLVRVQGFVHGTQVWENNGEPLVRKGIPISAIPGVREDIMQDLCRIGIPRNAAFLYAERIRKGKGWLPEQDREQLKEKVSALGDWYFEYCDKIRYMFPNAHAVTYTLLAVRCAWFKQYYPDVFRVECAKLKCK
ncbi:MAG: PHP domain-containing protein [Clostridia bacterium]|nr:PHP domain-containing protein [Clostridia bacterium]